jgi:hypothetical protein
MSWLAVDFITRRIKQQTVWYLPLNKDIFKYQNENAITIHIVYELFLEKSI